MFDMKNKVERMHINQIKLCPSCVVLDLYCHLTKLCCCKGDDFTKCIHVIGSYKNAIGQIQKMNAWSSCMR